MAQEARATQQLVDIEDIKDGVVLLKNGGLRKILLVSGMNFELKSEEEKNVIVSAYQEFLNSLDFSLQIIIHSRQLNTQGYLQNLKEREAAEKNALVKEQIKEYVEFIHSFVEENAIMQKSFLVVVPFDPIVVPEQANKLLGSLPFFGGAKKDTGAEKKQTFEEQAMQLNQRADHVTVGLSSVGLRVVALNNEELTELFYNLYNPQVVEKKGMSFAKQGR